MMAFADTEDPWIDYLIISKLGAAMLHPSFKFFKTEDLESRLMRCMLTLVRSRLN
jgi:hypothetical protein